MMVKHLILSCSVLFFTGCYQKSVIDTRMVETTCPKFPIEKFTEYGDYNIDGMSIININDKEYVQIPKQNLVDFLNYHKKMKSDYNVLRTNLIEFQKGK